MSRSAHDPETIQLYDREAARYADWSGRGRSDAFLSRLIEMLPAGGAVLDAGCGAGWDSQVLAAAGFNVVSIDASEGMVAQANRRRGVSAKCMRFDQLRSIEEFDGVWANSTLQHVARQELPGVLSILAETLKSRGYLFASVHSGTATRRDSLGRLYCHYTQEELTGIFAGAGLKMQSIHTSKGIGYDGSNVTSLLAECRKSAASGHE